MAEQSNDRLFETGCALCGAARCAPTVPFEYNYGLLYGPRHKNAGRRVCNACRAKFDNHGGTTDEAWAAADAEITRRLALTHPAPPAESEFFGTQPHDGELPATLPDGTRLINYLGGEWRIFGATLKYEGSKRVPYYGAERRERDGQAYGYGCHAPENIDWSRVPRPPAPPAIEQTAFKVGDECVATTAESATWFEPGVEVRGEVNAIISSLGVAWLFVQVDSVKRDIRCVLGSLRRPASTPPVRETTGAGSAEPCPHARRFRSGICVQCGELGPGEADAGYAIPKQTEKKRPRLTAALDPYIQHELSLDNSRRHPFRAWLAEQERIAASRMRSSRAEIESGRAKGAERGRHDWDPEDADAELRVS